VFERGQRRQEHRSRSLAMSWMMEAGFQLFLSLDKGLSWHPAACIRPGVPRVQNGSNLSGPALVVRESIHTAAPQNEAGRHFDPSQVQEFVDLTVLAHALGDRMRCP